MLSDFLNRLEKSWRRATCRHRDHRLRTPGGAYAYTQCAYCKRVKDFVSL